MSRYIDADALIADLDKGLWGEEWDKALAEAIIKDASTIDAVEVVRCRECTHYEEDWCYWRDEAITADEYCSYGERKE